MRLVRIGSAVCALVLMMSATSALAEAASPVSDYTRYTGTWVLDKNASDDPAEALAAGRTTGRSGTGGMHGGGMGGGGGRRGGGMGRRGSGMKGGRSGSQADAQRGAQAADLSTRNQLRRQKAMARLEIFTDGRELDITDGLDMTRLLSCDGRAKEVWTENGQAMASARLENGSIIETWSSGKGGGRTLTYTLSPDGNRLTVREERRTRRESDEPRVITLVYDRRE